MNKIISFAFIALLFMACNEKSFEVKEYNKGINIVPVPASLSQQEGVFKLNKKTQLVVKGDGAETVANFFNAKILHSTGFKLNLAESNSYNFISMNVDAATGLADEAYTLKVTSEFVELVASTNRGLFY